MERRGGPPRWITASERLGGSAWCEAAPRALERLLDRLAVSSHDEPLAVEPLALRVAGCRVGCEVVDRHPVERHLLGAVRPVDRGELRGVEPCTGRRRAAVAEERRPGGGALVVAGGLAVGVDRED